MEFVDLVKSFPGRKHRRRYSRRWIEKNAFFLANDYAFKPKNQKLLLAIYTSVYIYAWNFEIWDLSKAAYHVDLGESFQIRSIYLQKSALIQPRTSVPKFQVSFPPQKCSASRDFFLKLSGWVSWSRKTRLNLRSTLRHEFRVFTLWQFLWNSVN